MKWWQVVGIAVIKLLGAIWEALRVTYLANAGVRKLKRALRNWEGEEYEKID